MTESTAKLTEQELNDFGTSVNELNKSIVKVLPYLYAMHKEQQVIVHQWRRGGIASPEADMRLQRDFGAFNDKENNVNLDDSDSARIEYVRDQINNVQARQLSTRVQQPLVQQQQVVAAAADAPTRQSAATFINLAPESFYMAQPFEAPSPKLLLATKTSSLPSLPELYEAEPVTVV